MAALRMETAFGVRSSLDSVVRCGAHRQVSAVAVPASRRFQERNSFYGQRLRSKSSQSRQCSLLRPRSKTTVANVHQHGSGLAGSTSPIGRSPLGAEHILDDLSRYIYWKLRKAISPYLPPDFDALGWLPPSLHERVHKGEVPCCAEYCIVYQDRGFRAAAIVALPGATFQAIILLRELMHFGLFYLLFTRVDAICKWLNWVYRTNTNSKDFTEENYEASVFRAMASPMRLVIVVWAATRLGHLSAPLLRLRLGLHATAKIRSLGLVVAITWFFFKWKRKYVEKLAAENKLDAPRILAFDKVVSLLMYFVAASCIGEVTGFALRSLLAVGGFSGVALGLAAKEIVSNFFGGALLFTTRPFVIGERIKTGQISGHVQDIGFLQTRILSFDRMPMIVPNQNFINQVITNYSRAINKLLEAEFPLRMQDIFLVDRITTRVVKYLREHPEVDENKSSPVCYLKTLHSNDVILAVTCVLRPSGGAAFYRAQQSILVHIAEIIASEGAWTGSSEIPAVPSPGSSG